MIPLDRKILKQYLPLKREQQKLEKKINKLYDRLDDVPEVMGKVKASMREHPYIETHVSVQMAEPKETDTINRLIRINEARKQQVDKLLLEIEEFIEAIPDSNARQIFEMVFLDGKKQKEVAETVGYSRGRIPQIISKYLKD
ncbi:MAG: sigma factor-like helix-turn-helix DNA-binding protein [Lachnospiraceae bacterium]|nr:sigma factor-like helix-turn-helix DNA-binding protein [Lachnospiraceae bacterium]